MLMRKEPWIFNCTTFTTILQRVQLSLHHDTPHYTRQQKQDEMAKKISFEINIINYRAFKKLFVRVNFILELLFCPAFD